MRFCHRTDVINPLLQDSAFYIFNAHYELHESAEFLARVGQDIFESKEVNWFLGALSHVDPVVVPTVPGLGAAGLEVLPEFPDWILNQLLPETCNMCNRKAQVEK